jgi:hypothetical protein
MPYTEKAMIAVLQKVESALPDAGKRSHSPVQIHPNGANERYCYKLAISDKCKFVGGVPDGRVAYFSYEGIVELSRLIESRSKKRQEWFTLGMSFVALVFSAIAFFTSTNRSHVIFEQPIRLDQPLRIISVVETLLEETTPSNTHEEQSESCEADTNACESCTNIHEN